MADCADPIVLPVPSTQNFPKVLDGILRLGNVWGIPPPDGTPIDYDMGSGDLTSQSFYAPLYNGLTLQVVWTGVAGPPLNGVLRLEESLDDVNWSPVGGQAAAVDSAADNVVFKVSSFQSSYFRFVYTQNSISAGTLNARFLLKSSL